MKKLINHFYFMEVLLFILFAFSIEIIFRVVSLYEIVSYSTLRIFLGISIIAFLLGIFISYIKKKQTREKVWGFILFIISCYTFAEAGFKNFLGVYISLGTSSQAGAVTAYIREYILSINPFYYLIFVPFILYVIYYKMPKKWLKIKKKKINNINRVISLIIVMILSSGYYLTLILPFMQNELQIESNLDLFKQTTNSSIGINQFGTTMYLLLDMKSLLMPKKVLTDVVEIDEKLDEDDIFNKIIENEDNYTYNTLNKFYKNREKATPNKYTGLFKGKNLIVIMLESVNESIYKEEYFPNIAKLVKNGIKFENNYGPRNSCATSDSEFSGMVSQYAIGNSCTSNTYKDNTYFTSIFNLFRNKGYTTSSYHDYDETYYARDKYLPNYGCQNYYNANSLNINLVKDEIEWPSDVELIEKSSEIFTKDKPFMAWITTVTGHQSYGNYCETCNKYYELFEELGYSDDLKRYSSKIKITDDAIGKLLEILEKKGILDDTVIMVYGDHYPYGLKDEDVNQSLPYDILVNHERERVPFIIYNSEIDPIVINKRTSYMDFLPTIANLFGLDYDSRFYFGEDALNDNPNGLVIYPDSSWEDDVAIYDAGVGSVTYKGEKTYTASELQEINKKIYLNKKMSKLSIENDYFTYLYNKIKESDTYEKINDSRISSQE